MRDILYKHNKHWFGESMDGGVRREMLERVIELLEIRFILAISGARRSGKSYIFRQIINHLLKSGVDPKNLVQINFEDPFFIPFRDDPSILEKLYSEYLNLHNPKGRIYLFLDEIQNVENWEFWVRDVYDRLDHVKIFITGSNAELLSDELADHLTGRVISLENFPFSFVEFFRGLDARRLTDITEAPDPSTIYEQLFPHKEELLHFIEKSFRRGLFPEVAYLEKESIVATILSQYFQNVVFKDIVQRFSIRKTRTIEQLAYYLSTNFTSAYSYRKLAQAVGTNENTLKEYLSYFEKAYLFFPVDYFQYSLKKQFKRNRKIYMVDCGLRHSTAFTFSPDSGRYAENTVFQMLRRKYEKIFYWYDDQSKKEIDFIIKSKNKTIAINVCHADEIPPREFEAFSLFSKIASPSRNIIVTRNIFDHIKRNDLEIELIPLWVFVFLSSL